MTNTSLAEAYLRKAGDRLEILDVLHRKAAYSDVVPEAQEIVELALKGMLRAAGIDPPKWHDVGGFLVAHADRFPPTLVPHLPRAAEISSRMRRDRELSFYGDVDFIPTEAYKSADSRRARSDARWVVRLVARCIPRPRRARRG